MIEMTAFVINLMVRSDRWRSVEKQRALLGIPIQRVEAINQDSVDPNSLQLAAKGVAATWLSHRKAAAEFSFFLAVPTMFAATAKKIFDFYQDGHQISGAEINLLLIGNIVGFLVALVAIKSFISYLTNNGFRLFGIYRIVIGTIILVLLLSGQQLNLL